jgi:hypothetical protein
MGSGDSAKAGASAADENRKRPQEGFNVWTLGLGKLMTVGMDQDQARSFLGRQCKDFGKEAVADAVTRMLAQEPADPKAYLVAILQNNAKPPLIRPCRVDESMGAVRRVLEQKEAQRGTASGQVRP